MADEPAVTTDRLGDRNTTCAAGCSRRASRSSRAKLGSGPQDGERE